MAASGQPLGTEELKPSAEILRAVSLLEDWYTLPRLHPDEEPTLQVAVDALEEAGLNLIADGYRYIGTVFHGWPRYQEYRDAWESEWFDSFAFHVDTIQKATGNLGLSLWTSV